MKSITTSSKIVLILALIFLIQKFSFATIYDIKETYQGSQEVPPVITNGTGTITATYNDVTNQITFTAAWSGLTGTTTAAHFHGPAAVGANAGVQIGFGGFPLGVTSGTYSNVFVLTAAQETQLLGNMWYANIHSSFAGAGEIRAQLFPKLRTLSLTYLIEGLYDDGANLLVQDTVFVNIRSGVSPYGLVDAGKVNLTSAGTGSIVYSNALSGVPYYLQVLHRNGLETWSGAPAPFTAGALSYNFTTAAAQAYNSNMKLKGTRYCAYSGDPTADGTIDASDIVEIYNDALAGVFGYDPSDLTGDDFVDVDDIVITYNNSLNVVSVERP